MNKLIWFSTFTVLFIVFVLPGLFAVTLDMIPANDQPGYSVDNKLVLYGKRIVSQRFTSQEKNLTAIGVSLGNPNLKNKKEIIFSFYDTKGILERSSAINGVNLEDGDFVKFVFAPIADSKNKEYVFTIQTPEADQGEVIYAFHTNEIPSWVGELKLTEKEDVQELPGGLPFVTYHKPLSKLEVIKNIYSSWGKRIFTF